MAIHAHIDLSLRIPPVILIHYLASLDQEYEFIKSSNVLADVDSILSQLVYFLALAMCVTMVFLSSIQLLSIYATILLVLIVYISYLVNVFFIKDLLLFNYSSKTYELIEFNNILNKNFMLNEVIMHIYLKLLSIFSQTLVDPLPSVSSMFFLQTLLATCFLRLHNQVFTMNPVPLVSLDIKQQNNIVLRVYLFSILPLILLIISLPPKCVEVLPIIVVLFSAYNLINVIKVTHWNLSSNLKYFPHYLQIGINENGILGFIEDKWHKVNFPNIFRILFLYIMIVKLYILSFEKVPEEWCYDEWIYLAKELILAGTNNIFALLASTSAISFAARLFGNFFISLIGSNREVDKYFGQVCAITFFIISLQTSITSLSGEKRLLRIYSNTCLVILASLHFLHASTDERLQSVPIAFSLQKIHVKLLLIICLMGSFAIIFANKLWLENIISPWLLAAVAISIELSIKCMISLILYSLHIAEVHALSNTDNIENTIYFMKCTGRTLEFLVGIFLFFNGAWIFLFESGGTIRACVISVHAYFNIYCQAKLGWKSYTQRQRSWKHIQDLPCATKDQLQKYADVCSVCYQDLDSARVTNCKHMFHAACLLKWMSVQNTCPLCHNKIN